MEKSESIKELASALCKFQAEMGKVIKKETNPFFKNKYAPLPDVLSAVMGPLTANGLSVAQFPSGDHSLTTILMHNSGEFLSETYSMTPAKNDPQGLGSVITYQRRYALGAVLGLNIDEDDDGNNASQPTKATVAPPAGKPWLSQNQLSRAMYKIEHGELDIYQKTIDAFNMKPEYKARLDEAYKFSKNVA